MKKLFLGIDKTIIDFEENAKLKQLSIYSSEKGYYTTGRGFNYRGFPVKKGSLF